MSISDDQRRSLSLQFEGNVLNCAGHHDPSTACQVGRAQIDGIVNGLIRLEGAEPVTGFLFAVADRAAGGLRQPTGIAPPAHDRAPAVEEVLTLKTPAPWYERLSYGWGIAHGAVIAILVVNWWRRW